MGESERAKERERERERSNSSCASHGAKQETRRRSQKQRVRSKQNPWKKAALLGAERAKSLEKTSTFGCRKGKIPEKKQHFWVQRPQHPWKNNIFGRNEGKERAKSLEKKTAFSRTKCVNSYSFQTSRKKCLVCIGYEKFLWPSVLGRGPLLGLPAPPPPRVYA